MTDIRDEWVEKASIAAMSVAWPKQHWLRDLNERDRVEVRNQLRAALTSVADDIRADAWDEGYNAGDPYHRRGDPTDAMATNPYRAEKVGK